MFFCAALAACMGFCAPLPTTEEAFDAVADLGLPSLRGGWWRRRGLVGVGWRIGERDEVAMQA